MKFNSKRNIIEINELDNIHIPTAILHIHGLTVIIIAILSSFRVIHYEWFLWIIFFFTCHIANHTTDKIIRQYRINSTFAYYYRLGYILFLVLIKIVFSFI